MSETEINILKHQILGLLYDKEIENPDSTDFDELALTQKEIYDKLNISDNKQLHIILEDLIQSNEIDIQRSSESPPKFICENSGRKAYSEKKYLNLNTKLVNSLGNLRKKIQHEILDVLENRRIDWLSKLNTTEKFDQPMSISEINEILKYGESKISPFVFELLDKGYIGYDKRVHKFFIIDSGRTALYSKAFIIEGEIEKSNTKFENNITYNAPVYNSPFQQSLSGKNLSKNDLVTTKVQTPKKSITNTAIAIFIAVVAMIIGTYILIQLGWIKI